MKHPVLLAAAMLTASAGALGAHELFLRLESFFLEPRAGATVALRYGEFILSDSTLTPDRLVDVSIVGPAGEVVHPPASSWHEHDRTALLDFRAGDPGTYVIGVATTPTVIAFGGSELEHHLREDGVLDFIERREREGRTGQGAVVRSTRHARALIQVGDRTSHAWRHRFGHPAELVPLRNPYDLMLGNTLEVLALVDGEPAADQLVYANFAGNHVHGPSGGHVEAVQVRTDENGIARFLIRARSIWYVRFIRMSDAEDAEVDYESVSATLTFQIR